MKKTILLLLNDGFLIILSMVLAYLFRFDFYHWSAIRFDHAFVALLLIFIIYIAMFFVFKMQKVIWRFVSLFEMIRIAVSVFCGFVCAEFLLLLAFGLHYIPLSILPLQAVFYLILLAVNRSLYRLLQTDTDQKNKAKKVLIIGAGQASDGIIRDMLQNTDRGYVPVGILDDDPALTGRILRGVRVYGGIDTLIQYLPQIRPDMVIFAIPSIENNTLIQSVYEACTAVKVPLRVLPGLSHLTQGRINIDALKTVEIEDLLGRKPVKIVNEDLIEALKGKTVLVTGAGGSIGSELCHQIAMNRPKSLSIVDNSEYNLYMIHSALIKQFPALDITMSLADVSREDEIDAWFKQIKPQVVFHAAAFKHVPMLETQVLKAAKNNVFGTKIVADLAEKYGAEKFVLVSSDKAVNPTNVMGMTKRLAEIYCQTKNSHATTKYITVRFGNVLGSNGSVLPLFRKQLAAGGPLTVTHPEMTRYFMMIPEAVTLILQSFLLGQGGEIFVLEMGEPIKIVTLAERLITLSGQEPYAQIDIQFTGIRPGEKLFEEIFHGAEDMTKTDNKKILIAHCREYPQDEIEAMFATMADQYQQEQVDELLTSMLTLVPEYKGQYKQ